MKLQEGPTAARPQRLTRDPGVNAERMHALRELFPEAFPDGRLDPSALAEALGGSVPAEEDRFVFRWAGKAQSVLPLQGPVLVGLQPDRKASVDYDTTRNAIIRGDNLFALRLLANSYKNQVKLIYIDPPYNTGDDFVYRDDFQQGKREYRQASAEAAISKPDLEMVSEGGEGVVAGHLHSVWLSMMYPRLALARQLLRPDGIIVVSISDDELANLRLLMNELYGEENFIGCVVWHSTKTVTNTALISVSHTYNLVYARNREHFVKNRTEFRLPEDGSGFKNPDNDPRGPWKADPFQVGGERPNQLYSITNPKTGQVYRPKAGNSWKNEEEVFKRLMAENRIVFGVEGEAGPQRKRFLSEAEERGKVTDTLWEDALWDDLPGTGNATRKLDDLFEGKRVFDNPKPVELIRRFIQLGTGNAPTGLVLDFFAGSGTTAQAVLEQNRADGGDRRFLLVQANEPTHEDHQAREAGFTLVSAITIERIRRASQAMRNEAQGRLDRPTKEDLGFRVFDIIPSAFRQWDESPAPDPETLLTRLRAQVNTLLPDAPREAAAVEVILARGLLLDARGERLALQSNEVTRFTDSEGRSAYVCLDEQVKGDTVRLLPVQALDMFICRDSALTDQAAANLALKCNIRTV